MSAADEPVQTPGFKPPEGPLTSSEPSERNRLAAAMRRLTDVVVGRPMADDAYTSAADEVERLASDLEAVAGEGKRPRSQPDITGKPQDFFSTSPIIGLANPISPPVTIWAVEGDDGLPELRGRAHFSYAYEGPPTCVHGGVIAELFDEFLGSATIIRGRAGMTGTLTVRYRKPTPLMTDLDIVARRTTIEGRKIFAWGGIYHEGVLTAEAEGIFIEVKPAQMAGIVTTNSDQADGAVVDAQLAAFVRQQERLGTAE